MTFNRLKYGIAVLALITSALTGSQASAGTVTSTLINGLNTYEDKSRDIVVDVDGSHTLTVGDILYGFARLDNKATAVSGPLSTDSTYVVFSQTISAISAPFVDFAPTVGAYSLSTLTGDAIAASAFFALYEDYTADGFGDLLNNAAGAANIGTIAAGSFILSAGLGAALSEADDYFQAIGLNFLLPPGPLAVPVASFTAGLTVLQQPGLPGWTFHETVPGISFPAGLSFHQLGIGSGGVQSAGPAGSLNPSGYTYFDTLKVTVDATGVPEPMSMAVWGGLVGLGYAGAFRRRRV